MALQDKRKPRIKVKGPQSKDEQENGRIGGRDSSAPAGMVPIKGPVSPEAPRRPARAPTTSKRQASAGDLDASTLTLLKVLLDKVYTKTVPDELASNGERRLAEIFEELPSRNDYPDYYEHIPEPVSLNEIRAQLNDRHYRTPAAFHDEIRLVFLNAMHYNERGSGIWKDAKALEKLVLDEWEKLVARRQLPAMDEVRYIRSSDEESKVSSSPSPEDTTAAAALKRKRRGRKVSDVGSLEDGSPSAQYEPYSPKPFGFDLNLATEPLLYSGKKDPQMTVAELGRKNGFNGVLADRFDALVLKGKKNKGQDDSQSLQVQILNLLQKYQDREGSIVVADLINYDPPRSDIMSWHEISEKTKSKHFGSLLHFVCTLVKLFTVAREGTTEASPLFTASITMHRVLNWILSPLTPLSLPDPGQSILASIPHGPGNIPIDLGKKDDEEGRYRADETDGDSNSESGQVISPIDAVHIGRRLGAKDREMHDFVVYQGRLYKIGDYVLLSNPDDIGKPIVAQIFRLWSVMIQEKKQIFVNVCWYYRPEQTWHTPDTQFYQDELFKAGIVHDHTIEDVLGHCFVMFYTRYIRGRPKAPVWNEKWPLWICDSRYNEKEKSFNKIKSWNSCIPEELRGQEYDMEMYEKPVVLDKVDSPLAIGLLKGPGRILSAQDLSRKGLGGDIAKGHSKTSRPSIKAGRKPRRERSVGSVIRVVTPDAINEGNIDLEESHPVGDVGNGPQTVQEVDLLYQDAMMHHADQVQTPASSPTHMLLSSTLHLPMPGAADLVRAPAGNQGSTLQRVDPTKLASDAALPAQTARYFDRDEDGRVLWFSAPPLARSQSAISPHEGHSLNFLYLRATDGAQDSDGTYDLLGLDAHENEPSFSPSSASSSILDTASTSSSGSSKRNFDSTKPSVSSRTRSYKFPKMAHDDADEDDVVDQNDLASAGKNLELSLNAYETSESLAAALKELAEVYQGDALSVMPGLAQDDIHDDIATCI